MAATYLTRAGVAKLERQLEELKYQKRRLSEEMGKAREYGDLRENAEYHAAKERLQQVLAKIGELEFKLANVQVIDPKQLEEGVATLGTQVTVKDLTSSRQEQYILVGSDESEPAAGKISVQSPLGRAFLGHKVKEEVRVILPVGTRSYQILAIQPAE
jgi:transcription elongation factor GreA